MKANLPKEKYQIIYVDPPWRYYGSGDKWAAAEKEYSTMSDQEILDMHLENMLQKPGLLFMWATCPRLDFAIFCIHYWGLFYRGVAFNWIKTTKDGCVIGARGVRASITKPTSELVLVASNLAKGRPLKIADESIPQVVYAQPREHSSKPEIFASHIDSMYPDVSKIELFARKRTKRTGNWEFWGNELDSEIHPPERETLAEIYARWT